MKFWFGVFRNICKGTCSPTQKLELPLSNHQALNLYIFIMFFFSSSVYMNLHDETKESVDWQMKASLWSVRGAEWQPGYLYSSHPLTDYHKLQVHLQTHPHLQPISHLKSCNCNPCAVVCYMCSSKATTGEEILSHLLGTTSCWRTNSSTSRTMKTGNATKTFSTKSSTCLVSEHATVIYITDCWGCVVFFKIKWSQIFWISPKIHSVYLNVVLSVWETFHLQSDIFNKSIF